MCKDPENCTCSCQETATEGFWWGFGSVALGAAAFAGGVVLTVSTGGLGAVGIAAVIGGGALTGAGATAAIHPIAKQLNGERMTIGEYAKDVAIGGTIGAITGPIGAGGASATTSIASKVGTEGIKQGAVKLAGRTAVGAVSGATASVVQELTNPGEFSGMNVLKGAALGAATGGVGHVSGNISNQLSSGVAQSVTKVVADTAGAAVIDVTSQLIENGEVDGKRLALNVGARAATSAGYEAVASATYAANGGKEALKDKISDKKILDDIEDPVDKEKIIKAKDYIEKMDPKELEKQLQLADGKKAARANEALKEVRNERTLLEQETKDAINRAESQLKETKANPSLNPKVMSRKVEMLEGEIRALKEIAQTEQVQTQNQIADQKKVIDANTPQKLSDQKIHALGQLDQNKIGQFAADLPEKPIVNSAQPVPNVNNNNGQGELNSAHVNEVVSDRNMLEKETKNAIKSTYEKLRDTKANPSQEMSRKVEMLEGDIRALKDNLKWEQIETKNVIADAEKVGQPKPNNGKVHNSDRGARRVIYDVKRNEDGTYRAKIVAKIDDHNYKGAPGYGEVKGAELNESKPFIALKDDEDEKEKEKKKKKQQ